MTPLYFDAERLPPEDRLAAFRAGAVDFKVDATGDPLAFSVKWHLLQLGDLNAIRSSISPVNYVRTTEMIATDAQDRIAIHYYLQGSAEGMLNGQPASVASGGAMVWDMSETIDIRTDGPVEMAIITLPRFMIREVLPVASLSASLPPSPALALAAGQLCVMLDHADEIEDSSAPFFGRALRDLFAVAMLPSYPSMNDVTPGDGPLLRQISEAIDHNLTADITVRQIAAALATSSDAIRAAVDPAGGLAALVERRRLLAAYVLLADPGEVAPISAIAERCGFPDLPRFSRRFRETFHTTARDLRRRPFGNLPHWAGAYHVERNYRALLATSSR